MAEIGVSIICITYNHEKYIKDALDGFIMQKTDFPFEVLIHDDASTDKTAHIIREYEAKYPDIIHGFYENENLYSKGVNFLGFVSSAKGKYFAVCEGDDYWTDPLKLQKQYDALEAHPECDICSHKAVVMTDGKKTGHVAPSKKDTVFPADTVILGNGGFVCTCSLLLRASFIKGSELVKNSRPLFDYYIQIIASMRGGMIYLCTPMSVYRNLVPESWSSKYKSENYISTRRMILFWLKEFDKKTNGRFSDSVRQMKEYYEFLIDDSMEKAGEFYKSENKGVISFIPAKSRLRYFLWAKFPLLMRAKKKISGHFKQN